MPTDPDPDPRYAPQPWTAVMRQYAARRTGAPQPIRVRISRVAFAAEALGCPPRPLLVDQIVGQDWGFVREAGRCYVVEGSNEPQLAVAYLDGHGLRLEDAGAAPRTVA